MSNNSFTSVHANEFEQLIQQPDMQLVDVRTTEEYINGHISGAVNMNVTDPTGFFTEQIAELDKTKPVAIYCRSGVRSKLAAKEMISIGLQVYELGGGIMEWLDSGKPVDDIEDE
ncbi:MAG: rhodanese-like domain-containing protein [Bacteroidales bacterium]